jgi:CIC family chloride channel protein
MSSDYHIILPLMITCIISAVVARSIYSNNIYTVKLIRRGLDIESARFKDLLKRIPVKDAMTEKLEVIPHGLTVVEAYSMIENSRHQGFPLTDGNNIVMGVITRQDLYEALNGGRAGDPVQSLGGGELILSLPDEPLSTASRKLARYNIGRLPVVESLETGKLVGMLTRTDIICAYNSSLRPGKEATSPGGAGQAGGLPGNG